MSLGLLIVLLLAGGFGFLPSTALAGDSAVTPFADFYRAANESFSSVNLYKPGGTNTGDLTFRLAPLILQQVDQAGGPAADRFGAVGSSNGIPVVDLSRPTVYVQLDTITIRGEAHPQLCYLWFYPSEPAEPHRLLGQGVRLTLNSSGQPVIWEILGKTASAELIFASESLEAAAQARFGPPLPGRKYSIEPASSATPLVVVPRIIDDGPVPMGPIVYLRARTRSVSTIICRCMPAQAKAVRGSFNYDLVPLRSLGGVLLAHLRDRGGQRSAFWPADAENGSLPLAHQLRLPPHF